MNSRETDGVKIAQKVKNLVLYILTANGVKKLPESKFKYFLATIGAHIDDPIAVPNLPELLPVIKQIRDLSTGINFSVHEEQGVVYVVVQLMAGFWILFVPNEEPFPGVSGTMIDDDMNRWRFRISP
jgi:hypothetical protein